MTETNFHSVGRIDVTMENTWPEVMDQVIEEILNDTGGFEMTSFECNIVETGDGRVYKWEAEGKIK